MPGIRIPWKVQQFAKSVFGEDWVYKRATFHPDFSERSFARLPLGNMQPGQFKQQVVEKFLRQRTEFLVPLDKVISLADDITAHHPKWRDNILNAAADICDTGLPIYHLQGSPLTSSFPWKSLENGPYNDQLFRSRPQRFGFAPVLAQAALFDQKYVGLLEDILQGWQQYARTSRYRWPYNSSHAVVYRVVALCFCWTFIGAIHQQDSRPESESVLYRILNILRNDILFLGPCIGGGFPNNHLLADYFVGWLLHVMFPELVPDSMDFSIYEEKWQQELLRQFYPDGGSFEHAIHYQEHGCEMAIIYRLLVEKQSIPAEIDRRIGQILRFQAGLSGPLCRPWALGDTTEDTLLPLDPTPGWSSNAILGVHNFLYPERSLFSSEAKSDQKAFWLLAGECSPLQSGDSQKMIIEQYPDSGFVNWVDLDQKNELLFRTGGSPQSDLIAGHMHADVLSLFWRVKGIDLLAASGTYTYKFIRGAAENYRDYFCGPWSHSCVLIEGKDPLGPVDADFRRRDNGLRVVSNTCGDPAIASLCIGQIQSDNCYDGLRRGVLHLPHDFTLVFDVFTASQSAMKIGACWQFGAEVDVRCNTGLDLLVDNLAMGKIIFSPGGTLQLSRGQDAPIRGWHSGSYGTKVETNHAHIDYPENTRMFAHALTPATDALGHSIELALFDDDYAVLKVNSARGENTIYISLCDAEREFHIDNMVISANAIVHQKRFDNSSILNLIDCHSIDGPERALRFETGKTLQLRRYAVGDCWEI